MSEDPDPGAITVYLQRLSAGDASAEAPLAEAVYARIQRLARAMMRNRRPDVLQPTALANEVLLELVRLRSIDWENRVHFYRVASRMLRRRLTDHIKAEQAAKRPSAAYRVHMDEVLLPAPEKFQEVLLVHEGLDALAEFDPDLAELIEMIYFGGLTIAAAAEMRGVSEKTIDRHLDLGRRWLARFFSPACPQPPDFLAAANGK